MEKNKWDWRENGDEKNRSVGGKWRRTEHGFYLLCVPEGSFMALKFKTSRDKFFSILSYPDRNGLEAGTQLSSRLLGIKIHFPVGMAKASIILEKIKRLLCSLLLLGLSVPGLNSLLGTSSIQKMTAIEGNNRNALIPRWNQAAPLTDKGWLSAAGRAGLHCSGAFPPLGPLPKSKAQPQSGVEEK